jgi:plastocyanin
MLHQARRRRRARREAVLDKQYRVADGPQQEWGYAPEAMHVAAGSWVVWSNAGADAHTVTAADASFDSHELNPSEGYSVFFTTPGTYAYFCTLHPWMQGSVVVDG